MARIDLDLAHAYKANPQGDDDYALLPLAMSFADGGAYALLGPSGCGKTTTLRMVAGLERTDRGSIAIGDRLVSDAASGLFLPPDQRNLGMVFQSYAIWPHMTVAGNVGYPLKVRKAPKSEIAERVAFILSLVGLGELG